MPAVTTSEYQVQIHYREPTYRQHKSGEPERPAYHWTYRVVATDPDQAKGLALAEFRRIASDSSVGWVREVLRVELSAA